MRQKKDYMQRYYPESRFGGFTDVDGTIAFYMRVRALMAADAVVLDIGCGRGAFADDPVQVRRDLRIFKGRCQRVIGIDVDARAAQHPFLDEFGLIEGGRWPVEDASVDLCVSDFVLEHVADPEQYFAECARVTRPGGHVCIRTPNALNYISLLARLVPNRRHAEVLDKVLCAEKPEEDTFPTVFRCNTTWRLRRALDRHGFEPCVYGFEAEPYHLGFCRPAYLCGMLHQRFAPRLFRTTLFAFAKRK